MGKKNRYNTFYDKQGRRMVRPSGNHPSPLYWNALRVTRGEAQRTTAGLIHCGTCSYEVAKLSGFDLHHRHYDNFGKEELGDVVLLCRPCHDAITSRIRLVTLDMDTVVAEGATPDKWDRPQKEKRIPPPVLTHEQGEKEVRILKPNRKSILV